MPQFVLVTVGMAACLAAFLFTTAIPMSTSSLFARVKPRMWPIELGRSVGLSRMHNTLHKAPTFVNDRDWDSKNWQRQERSKSYTSGTLSPPESSGQGVSAIIIAGLTGAGVLILLRTMLYKFAQLGSVTECSAGKEASPFAKGSTPNPRDRHALGQIVTACAVASASAFVQPSAAAAPPPAPPAVAPGRVAIAAEDGLGVVGGDLAFCRNMAACVSSQDDRPAVWTEPWMYESSMETARNRLIDAVLDLPGSSITVEEGRYLRANFKDPLTGDVDVAEFYFTPNDNTVQFRAERRPGRAARTLVGQVLSGADFGGNYQRLEDLRIRLRFEKVPVLRYRRRVLGVIQSPFDSFGPDTNSFYAVDPEEMDLNAAGEDPGPRRPGLWNRIQDAVIGEVDDHIATK